MLDGGHFVVELICLNLVVLEYIPPEALRGASRRFL
jgi:hypothetical protein